jgi:hypothetical protein
MVGTAALDETPPVAATRPTTAAAIKLNRVDIPKSSG